MSPFPRTAYLIECVKKFVAILLSLCGLTIIVIAVHRWSDTIRGEQWPRTLEPRLSLTGEWRKCPEMVCDGPKTHPPRACNATIKTPAEALTFLAEQPQCTREAIAAIRRVTPRDLPAAYLYSADVHQRPGDLLLAATAAEKAVRSSPTDATRFNRALVYEKLRLNEQAISAWNEVLQSERDPQWAAEARERIARLKPVNGAEQWLLQDRVRLDSALRRGDRASVAEVVRRFPGASMRFLEDLVSAGGDLTSARLLAVELGRFTGDRYPQALVDASSSPRDAAALVRGHASFAEARRLEISNGCDAAMASYRNAEALLARAGSPLRDTAQLALQACLALDWNETPRVLSMVEALSTEFEANRYDHLAARAATLRAYLFLARDRYPEAIATYERAAELYTRVHDDAGVATAISRNSGVYLRAGQRDLAWEHALQSLALLPRVWDPKEQNNILGTAAQAASAHHQFNVALLYQRTAVDRVEAALQQTPSLKTTKLQHNLAIALRALADLEFQVGYPGAPADLLRARTSVDGLPKNTRIALQMSLDEVEARAKLTTEPGESIRLFSRALDAARNDSATVRTALLLQRAYARRLLNDDAGAEQDLDAALSTLQAEERNVLASRKRGDREELWSPYFARFQDVYRARAEDRIATKDYDEAFAFSEQARGFEPLYLLLHSQSVPPAFRRLAASTDPNVLRAELPPGVFVLQYLVLENRSYAWILSSESDVKVPVLAAKREEIELWVEELHRAAQDHDKNAFRRSLLAPYAGLLALPMDLIRQMNRGRAPNLLVIIPDGAMHGLPFPALRDAATNQSLIEQTRIAVAGSTRLFLYSWMRNAALRNDGVVRIAAFGDPAADPELLKAEHLDRLPAAQSEADAVFRFYGGQGARRVDTEATVSEFLSLAPSSDIIHFAGHAVVNPEMPFNSHLLFAPEQDHSGFLTAADILTNLEKLDRTRLVVLGACSSAGGSSVGPEGMAPLVRPFIAANVPAVIGSLWNVDDATTKQLLVSFHRHYRNGDDVTAALQKAQLEMLRKDDAETSSALAWGAFQVIGYASSPFASSAGTEERQSEHVHSQNSLQRPDGLHPR